MSESIYYKTLKTSETGMKFAEVMAKSKELSGQIRKFCEEHDIISYQKPTYKMVGGLERVEFRNGVIPDPNVWRKNGGFWSPRRNTKAGKAMAAILDALPELDVHELNMCIGFNGSPFRHIGLRKGSDTHQFFSVGAGWEDLVIPSDCVEITHSEYYNTKEPV